MDKFIFLMLVMFVVMCAIAGMLVGVSYIWFPSHHEVLGKIGQTIAIIGVPPAFLALIIWGTRFDFGDQL